MPCYKASRRHLQLAASLLVGLPVRGADVIEESSPPGVASVACRMDLQ